MSTGEPLVVVEGLVRHFEQVRALIGVSFTLEAGQVVGLIGANGAGKTTTMRILATLDTPDAGRVRLRGIDIVDHPECARPRVGWMPDHFGPYPQTTVSDYLDFFARALGLRHAARAARLEEVVAFTELGELLDRPMDKLSKGQTQRLALARTLLSDPELLILDEPAAGLDPRARLEFKNLVRLLRERGKTLLISSHILSELGEMCDTLLFMDAGRVMHHGDLASLMRADEGTAGPGVEIAVAGGTEALLGWLAVRPGWTDVAPARTGARAVFAGGGDDLTLAAELRRLVLDGVAVVEFRRQERRLEEAFVSMLSGGGLGRGTGAPPRLRPGGADGRSRPPTAETGAGGAADAANGNPAGGAPASPAPGEGGVSP